MLTKILGWIARIALGKQLLAIVDGLNQKLTGHRSELIVAIIAILETLKHLQILESAIADPAINTLMGALPVTLAEKIGNIAKEADQIIPPPSAKPSA